MTLEELFADMAQAEHTEGELTIMACLWLIEKQGYASFTELVERVPIVLQIYRSTQAKYTFVVGDEVKLTELGRKLAEPVVHWNVE